MWRGWVAGPRDGRTRLEAAGVAVLSSTEDVYGHEWPVEMSDTALTAIEPLWGEFVWGLRDDDDQEIGA